ncbi:MAG: general substrate transporter [Monoraphidium minutum]|nr:MAG: general substrate transporter [Monoraphidium minutum]
MAGGAIVSGPGGRSAEYAKGRITLYVVLACFVGACTGLVFGYDIGIAGGVVAMPEFQKAFFPHVYQMSLAPKDAGHDSFCKYDDPMISLFVSVLFLAGIPGAFLGSWTNKWWGRRPTMMVGGANFLVGAVLMAAATHIAMLVVGRIFLGIGIGICVQCGPLFLSELAPAHLRGLFNTQFQLFITFGIVAAQIINYSTQHMLIGWRISLGLAGVPAVMLILGCIFVPETPNSLVERGHVEQAKETLAKIRGTEDIGPELDDIIEAARFARATSKGAWSSLFKRRYLPQLILTIALPTFNQFDGINSIMFYAPQLFDAMGQGASQALLTHVIIGAVNVGTTLVAVLTVDRLGRKFWLVQASFQMMAAEIAMTAVIATQMSPAGGLSPHATAGLLVVVCVFIAGHAWGWGPMAWLVVSEVQPLHMRAAGTAFGTMVNFLMSFIIGQFFLTLMCQCKAYVFLFFAGWLLFMGIFVILFVPETKGVPIEAIEDELIKKHWFWGKVMARTWAAEAEADVRAAISDTSSDTDAPSGDGVKITLTAAQRKAAKGGGSNASDDL